MKIKKTLDQKIEWKQDSANIKMFYSPALQRNSHWLRMNDFPEEPLWTLHWEGEELDIEDTPLQWEIKYND